LKALKNTEKNTLSKQGVVSQRGGVLGGGGGVNTVKTLKFEKGNFAASHPDVFN